jgi:hypothetical protein
MIEDMDGPFDAVLANANGVLGRLVGNKVI